MIQLNLSERIPHESDFGFRFSAAEETGHDSSPPPLCLMHTENRLEDFVVEELMWPISEAQNCVAWQCGNIV